MTTAELTEKFTELEAHIAEALGMLPRLGDRRVVKVDADELRLRERLRHDDRRRAVPANGIMLTLHELGVDPRKEPEG